MSIYTYLYNQNSTTAVARPNLIIMKLGSVPELHYPMTPLSTAQTPGLKC